MIFQNYISKILRESYLIFIRINQNRKYIRNIPLNFSRRKPSNVSVSIFYLAKIPPSKTMKQWKLFENEQLPNDYIVSQTRNSTSNARPIYSSRSKPWMYMARIFAFPTRERYINIYIYIGWITKRNAINVTFFSSSTKLLRLERDYAEIDRPYCPLLHCGHAALRYRIELHRGTRKNILCRIHIDQK